MAVAFASEGESTDDELRRGGKSCKSAGMEGGTGTERSSM